MAAGQSYAEAAKAVMVEWMTNTAKSALGGAISGGVFGTVGSGIVVLADKMEYKSLPSSYIDKSTEAHTPEQQRRIDEYKRAVDGNVVAFVEKVRSLVNPRYRSKITHSISPVSERQAAKVYDLLGVDVSEYDNIIDGDAVDHIDHDHGEQGETDRSMADINDFGRIGYVLGNFDGAEVLYSKDGSLRTSKKWKDRDGTRAPMIRFYKKIDGAMSVVEAIPDSNRKSLAVVSAYMQKNSGGSVAVPVLNMPNNGPQLTAEPPAGAPTSTNANISNAGEIVKGNDGDGLGAADAGFDPVSRWQMETSDYHPVNEAAAARTMEAHGRAPFDMPKKDINGRLTSKQASTLANARITTNEMAGVLEKAAMEGQFSYLEYKDSEAIQKAEADIKQNGWDACFGDYQGAVQRGQVSKDISTMGILLYNQAVTSGDYYAAMDVATLMCRNSRNAAQAIQVSVEVVRAPGLVPGVSRFDVIGLGLDFLFFKCHDIFSFQNWERPEGIRRVDGSLFLCYIECGIKRFGLCCFRLSPVRWWPLLFPPYFYNKETARQLNNSAERFLFGVVYFCSAVVTYTRMIFFISSGV